MLTTQRCFMKIDEIISAIHDKRKCLIALNADCNYEPILAVYMNYDYWVECKMEIQGEVSRAIDGFFHDDTIMGYPVWKVSPSFAKEKNKEHVPFMIVNTET